MITFKEFLFEARRNPEINSKKRVFDQVKPLYQKYPDAYITFTQLPKFGANPQSKWNTPFGIYAYPLKYALDEYLDVPFAGDAPYIYVFTVNDNANILQITDEPEDYDKWIDAMDKVLGVDEYQKEWEQPGILRFAKNVWYHMYDRISLKFTGEKYDPEGEENSKYGVIARKILRAAGYTGVVDPGFGVIHGNEPTQAVFFDISNLKVVDKIRNVYIRKHDSKLFTKIAGKGQWEKRFQYALQSHIRDRDVENTAHKFFDPDFHDSYIFIEYATSVRQRVPAFEPYIISNPSIAVLYANDVLHRRWPEAEDAIASEPSAAYSYARNVIKGRWSKGESAIKQHPLFLRRYIEFLKSKNISTADLEQK